MKAAAFNIEKPAHLIGSQIPPEAYGYLRQFPLILFISESSSDIVMNNDIMPGINRPKNSKTVAKKKVAKLENQEDLNLAIYRKWVKAQSALLFKNSAQISTKV